MDDYLVVGDFLDAVCLIILLIGVPINFQFNRDRVIGMLNSEELYAVHQDRDL